MSDISLSFRIFEFNNHVVKLINVISYIRILYLLGMDMEDKRLM